MDWFAAWRFKMRTGVLNGRAILVVEDEPLIALDIAEALGAAGAICLTMNTLKEALDAVERPGIKGAIVDCALKDGDTTSLCERLNERGIPFMIYSGFSKTGRGACAAAPHLEKPATEAQLVTAMVNLILRQSATN
jgi:DNA-binding response OmpR family regulator